MGCSMGSPNTRITLCTHPAICHMFPPVIASGTSQIMSAPTTDDDFGDMSTNELREECREAKILATGTRAALVKRLREWSESNNKAPETCQPCR